MSTANQPTQRQEYAALLSIPFHVLAELLHLPTGARIDTVRTPDDIEGTVFIRLRGSGWAVKPGEVIPWAVATITEYRDEDGQCFKRVVEWGLPNAEFSSPPATAVEKQDAGRGGSAATQG